MKTANFTLTLGTTTVTPISVSVITTTVATVWSTSTIAPSSTVSIDPHQIAPTPQPDNHTNSMPVAYATDCTDNGSGDCIAKWFFYNAVDNFTFDVCLDLGSSLDAGTVTESADVRYPEMLLDVGNVTGESGCWYNGATATQPGAMYCDFFAALGKSPIQCDNFTGPVATLDTYCP